MSGTVASHPSFLTTHVDDVPLDAVLRAHRRLPIPVVQTVLFRLCAALQQAHDHGVTHGDVTPANVRVDVDGNVHMNGFAVARDAEYQRVMRTMISVTASEYSSPEQCLGRPTSFASDQYSLGAIGYELLTGRPPFVGPPVEMQRAHVSDLPAWPGFARRECPTALAATIMRMLAKEPNERWPTLRSAIACLARVSSSDADGGQAALARLVRSTPFPGPTMTVMAPGHVPPRSVWQSISGWTIPSTPRPKRPVPVASLGVAPRSRPPVLGGDARRLTAEILAAVARGGRWSRRLAIAAGLLTTAATVALVELLAKA
jgi:eukaryotic-like serine/threonine-protein kinase